MPDYPDVIFSYLERAWDKSKLDPVFRSDMRQLLVLLWDASSGQQSGKGRISIFDLPAQVCFAVSGNSKPAEVVSVIWSVFYSVFHLLDKIEDNECTEITSGRFNSGQLLHLATSLMISSELMLGELENWTGMSGQTATCLRLAFNRQILEMGSGQHLDLSPDQPDLGICWQIAEKKSGSLFALGCFAGARVVTDDEQILQKLEVYGLHLGTLLQTANDIQGLWKNSSGKSDLTQNKKNIALVFALQVLPSSEAAYLSHLVDQASKNAEAPVIALDIIVKSGALVYLALEAETRKNIARNMLDQLNLRSKGRLLTILAERGVFID